MLQGGVQLLLKWCGFYKPDISGTQEMVSWALMVVYCNNLFSCFKEKMWKEMSL